MMEELQWVQETWVGWVGKVSLGLLKKHMKSEMILFSVSGMHSSATPPLKSCWTLLLPESKFLLQTLEKTTGFLKNHRII